MAIGDTASGSMNLAKGLAKKLKPPPAVDEIADILMKRDVPKSLTKKFHTTEITKRINNALSALTSRALAPQGMKVQDWQNEQERQRMLKSLQR